MALNHHIDVYCERTDFTFWSEPINALTNAAFIIAGFAAVRLYRREGCHDRLAALMIGLIFAIGVGSFLFHTFATRWAALADVIPIALIILTYHYATMHKIAGYHWGVASASLMLIPILGFVVYLLPLDFMGSTQAYAPILPLLCLYFYYHRKHNAAELWLLPMTFGVFAISMTTRAIDYPLCDIIPLGTHWGWHVFNGLALYLALRAYILNSGR